MRGITKRGVAITLIGFLVSRTAFLAMDPIAVAFFTAAFAERIMRTYVLIGVIAGSAMVLPTVEAVKYTFVIIILSIIESLYENRNNNKPIALPAFSVIAAAVTAGISLTKYLFRFGTVMQFIYVALESVIILSLSFVFSKTIKFILYARRGQVMGNEELISTAIVAGIAIFSIPNFGLQYFSLFQTVMFFLILVMGYKYGAGAGAITGTTCGIVLGLQQYINFSKFEVDQNFFSMIAIMCCIGILSGMFREAGRIATALAYVLGIVALHSMSDEFMLTTSLIGAVASAVIVFTLLPKSMMKKIEGQQEQKQNMEFLEENIKNMIRQRLGSFSDSFQKLSTTFHTMTNMKTSLSRQEVDMIFDDLSNRLCKNCNNCSKCWKDDFYDTYKATFNILSAVEEKGEIRKEDIPNAFANRCVNLGAFLSEANRSLEIAKMNMKWSNKMAESREAVADQLGEVAKIIDDFSVDFSEKIFISSSNEDTIKNQLRLCHVQVKQVSIIEKRNKKQSIYITARIGKGRCMTTREAASIISRAIGHKVKPDDSCKNILSKDYETYIFVEDVVFKVLTGVAKVPRQGEKISGDNFSVMPLETGNMILTLSDGMGSGKLACDESESVVELLEQLIDAGFKEDSAIKLINSILVSRSESSMFSTVDMSIINLYTGICEFIKIGASTTYIKRDNWVESISSTTLPVGMFQKVDYDAITKKMYDGDFIIMVTDGVLDCITVEDKEKEMEEIIMSIKSKNPQEVANQILAKAIQYNENKAIDDMTVLVAGIWKKY